MAIIKYLRLTKAKYLELGDKAADRDVWQSLVERIETAGELDESDKSSIRKPRTK